MFGYAERACVSFAAGMSWCGYRPSDDPQQYGYNVPVNMYAQAAVERALQLNAAIWHSHSFQEKATRLARTMRQGGKALPRPPACVVECACQLLLLIGARFRCRRDCRH